jgi:hypothetical protein
MGTSISGESGFSASISASATFANSSIETLCRIA